MAIDIRKFVDVKIKKAVPGRQLEYDTVIVFDPNGTNTPGYYGTVQTAGDGKTKATAKDITTLVNGTTVNIKDWATIFVKNGGQYIHYLTSLTYDTVKDAWCTGAGATLQEIPFTEIVICAFGKITGGTGDLPYGSGIQQKIILTGKAASNANVVPAEGVVQLGEATGNKPELVVNATLAAYFTQININLADTIRDCMFTRVICTAEEANTYAADFTTLDADTYIPMAYFANDYRLIGGNDCLKNDIVNVWAKIVLTQVLTNTLIILLTSKIRLNTAGIASVKNCCTNVLSQFVTNGYIMTDKAWTDPDLYIDGNLVAGENTPLVDGYTVYVGPILQEHIKNHQIPPVYILFGDQVGVRKIVVTGEVF